MSPELITCESFQFKQKVKPLTSNPKVFKKSLGPGKRLSKANAKGGHQLTRPVEVNLPLELINTQNLPQLLQRHTIYIDKTLWNQAQIKQIAEGMGATVKPTLDKSITVFIVEPRGGERQSKLISQASNNARRCASPTWITTCYNERKYYSPADFPYDINASKSKLQVAPIETNNDNDDDNPFGVEAVDYDLIEATRPGNQLKLDGYITREARTTEEEQDTIPSSDYMETQEEETFEAQLADEEEEEDDEEEEMKREFNYNKSSSSSNSNSRKTQETPEETEARRAISLRRMQSLQKEIEQAENRMKEADTSTSSSQDERLKRKVMSGVSAPPGQQRLKIWYGEQQISKS